MLFNFILNIYM